MTITETKYVASVTVLDPDTGNPVEMEIRKCDHGGMVGIDGSALMQDLDLFDPYNQNVGLDVPDDEFGQHRIKIGQDCCGVFVINDGLIEQSCLCKESDQAEIIFIEWCRVNNPGFDEEIDMEDALDEGFHLISVAPNKSVQLHHFTDVPNLEPQFKPKDKVFFSNKLHQVVRVLFKEIWISSVFMENPDNTPIGLIDVVSPSQLIKIS
jgi:hypothetical protein